MCKPSENPKCDAIFLDTLNLYISRDQAMVFRSYANISGGGNCGLAIPSKK